MSTILEGLETEGLEEVYVKEGVDIIERYGKSKESTEKEQAGCLFIPLSYYALKRATH